MPHKIKDETNDRIVIVESKPFKIDGGLVHIILGFLSLYITYHASGIGGLFFLILGGVFFLIGSNMLLVSKSITLDENTQSVINQQKSVIKHLESIEKIPFSELKEIEISRTCGEWGESWSTCINTICGKPVLDYDADDKTEAERVAKKISKLTNKEIIYNIRV
jgi:hypothetical protein